MSNELLYLGIGVAAVYLFARKRRDVLQNVSTGVLQNVSTGVVPRIVTPSGRTPNIDPGYIDPGYNVMPITLPGGDGINPKTGLPYTAEERFTKVINDSLFINLAKTTQPLGLDAGGNIVFGADSTDVSRDSTDVSRNVSIDQTAAYKVNPVDIDIMAAALQNYAKTQNVSIKAAYERYLDIYVNGGDMVNVDIVNAAWNKLNPVVAKAGIRMLATVAALAAGYYVIVNH